MDRATFGHFLRAKREGVHPEEAGRQRRRRTPGLRRDDVAERAGISADWYARLEQNRVAAVSDAVLDRLSAALGLAASERAYLYRLAGRDALVVPSPMATPHATALTLLQRIGDIPACVANARGDILASNPLHERLMLGYGAHPRFGRNMVWFMFCDPRAPDLFPDHQLDMERVTATLRLTTTQPPVDPGVSELIDELSAKSPDFQRLWSRQSVRQRGLVRKRFTHPSCGALEFVAHSVSPVEAPQQTIAFLEPADAATRRGLRRLLADVET